MNKIIIVDDHPILRRGLTSLIESEGDLLVSGQAGSRSSALKLMLDQEPDVVVVDIMLNGSDGIQLLKDLKARHPTVPALVLSMYDESVYAERALRAGAKGYLTKKQLDETVLTALRKIIAGGVFMTEQLKARLAEKYINGNSMGPSSPVDALSDRELQVYQQIGQGRATRQIAERFSLSIKTVESHLEHIKQKLTISSAAELAQSATRWVETGRSH